MLSKTKRTVNEAANSRCKPLIFLIRAVLSKEKRPANEEDIRRYKFYTQLVKLYNEINSLPMLYYELNYSSTPDKASKLVNYTHTHLEPTDGELSELNAVTLSPSVANLPQSGKKYYYVIISKNEGISSINHCLLYTSPSPRDS